MHNGLYNEGVAKSVHVKMSCKCGQDVTLFININHEKLCFFEPAGQLVELVVMSIEHSL